jgi:hypothetical protein
MGTATNELAFFQVGFYPVIQSLDILPVVRHGDNSLYLSRKAEVQHLRFEVRADENISRSSVNAARIGLCLLGLGQ